MARSEKEQKALDRLLSKNVEGDEFIDIVESEAQVRLIFDKLPSKVEDAVIRELSRDEPSFETWDFVLEKFSEEISGDLADESLMRPYKRKVAVRRAAVALNISGLEKGGPSTDIETWPRMRSGCSERMAATFYSWISRLIDTATWPVEAAEQFCVIMGYQLILADGDPYDVCFDQDNLIHTRIGMAYTRLARDWPRDLPLINEIGRYGLSPDRFMQMFERGGFEAIARHIEEKRGKRERRVVAAG